MATAGADFSSLAHALEALQDELKCSICLSLMHHPVSKLKCNHYFCGDCLTEALQHNSRQCPMCKQKTSRREVDQDSKVSAVVDIARHLLAAHGRLDLSGSQVPPPLPDVDAVLFGAPPPGRAASPSRYETAPQSQPDSTAGDDDAAPVAPAAARSKPAGKALTTFQRTGKAGGGGAAAAGRSTRGKAVRRGGGRQAAPAAQDDDDEGEAALVAPVSRGRGEPDVEADAGQVDEDFPLVGGLDLGPMFDVAGDDGMEEEDPPPPGYIMPLAEPAAAAGVASTRRKRGGQKEPHGGGGGGAPDAALRTPAAPRSTAPVSSATPGTGAATPGALLLAGAPSGRVKREAAADWACAKCTLLNPITRNNCLVCNAKKGTAKAAVADAPPAEAAAEAAAALMSPPPPVAMRGADTQLKRRLPGAAASTPLVPSTEKPAAKRARKAVREAGDGDAGDGGAPAPSAIAGGELSAQKGAAEGGRSREVWASKQAWVITSSGMEGADKEALKQLAAVAGCTYTKEWSSDVTHVVALVDAQRRAPRTVKLMCGVLTGTWVVSPSWVAACLAASGPVEEADHEVDGMTVDGQPLGPAGMPAAQRARCQAGEPPLLSGLRIHLSGDFGLTGAGLPKAALEQLVGLGGGRALRHAPNPPDPGKVADPSIRILCDGTPRSGGAPLRGAEAAAVSTGCDVLSSTWLLDCVAHGQLLPTQPYVLVHAP